MCDNEYLAHQMVRERLREAEARGVLNAMIREVGTLEPRAGADGRRPWTGWLDAWRQAPGAWLAHLTLPKIWNRF